MPYTWRNALHFEGAWDAGYAKWLFIQYGMESLSPSKAYCARAATSSSMGVRGRSGRFIFAL